MQENIFKNIGANIQKYLSESGKTEKILTEKLNISEESVQSIIAGKKILNIEELTGIGEILNVSIEDLLEENKEIRHSHKFSYMGKIKSDKTKEKIAIVEKIIDEIIFLEEYGG